MKVEEKAKAYDGNYKAYTVLINRLENVKDAIKKQNYGIAMDILCKPYPEFQITTSIELAESEDERIRKALIRYFTLSDEHAYNEACGVSYRDIVAWLEKQGEQKPAYNVKPKFKIGYWITNGINTNKIIGIDLKNEDYLFENCISDISLVDSISHLWSIQDAKDGDVLHVSSFSSDCIFIFDRLDKWKFDEPNGERAVATGHCCLTLSADNMEFGIQGPDYIEVDTVKPATKIQRDLLFQKMKEAGYEWDADKKELKKIIDEKQIKKNLQDNSFRRMFEQNHTWNKDDEKMYNDICSDIEKASNNIYMPELTNRYLKQLDWFKSLKDRVQPQPKQEWKQENTGDLTDFETAMMHIGDSFFGQYAGLDPNDTNAIKEQANLLLELAPKLAWSEEDSEMFGYALDMIEYYGGKNENKVRLVSNWLKSIKDRVQPQNK